MAVSRWIPMRLLHATPRVDCREQTRAVDGRSPLLKTGHNIARENICRRPCVSSYVLGLSSLRMYLASAACSSLKNKVLPHSLLPSPLRLFLAKQTQTVVQLRKQQADVETLKKAERLVEGKHWSSEQDSRISTLNSMLEDSRARLQAQEASARQVAAETVSILVQILFTDMKHN
jgi:hypothetical protein